MAVIAQETEIKPGYKRTEVGVIPEDWKVKELGELTTLLTNGFVGKATNFYTNSDDGVIYIQGFNVEENSYNFTGIKRVTLEFHSKHARSCLREGDLLTIQTGEIGLTTVVTKELEGSNCHALIISRFEKKLDSKYFSYYFNSFNGKSRFKDIETGSTMKHLNVGDLYTWLVPFPPTKSEQTAVATTLSDIDALITSLDKLIIKKHDIKQATMQQLLTGKTQLPGFSGEWRVKRLGEILRVRHGKSQYGIAVSDGKYPILATSGEIGRTNNYLYDKPSVLIGRKGTIDSPQYMNTPFWTIDTLFYTEIADYIHPRFVFYLFNMIDWLKYNEASGVPSLNTSTIEDIEVQCPSFTEQQAINTVLSDMDTEIVALEQKRDKTRALKQGMMQELLTGKTRLL